VTRIRLGISTCPNDTFAFHALLCGAIDLDGFQFDVQLLDVEDLNQGMAAGRFDVAKMSFHAMLHQAGDLRLLSAGSALGFGVGPVVLSRAGYHQAPPAVPKVLTPGRWTTASLLWLLFHGKGPKSRDMAPVVFSEIMPALQRGEADLGICIHEGRFTWRESGLELAEDLGARWERETNSPLPLGGIAARRSLDEPTAIRLARVVRRSVEWARANPKSCLPSMASHAQEQTEAVLWSHVELYVNEWTVDLGKEGAAAIDVLNKLAAGAGLAPSGQLDIAWAEPA
jgi:1,4-dihydroxy-6-naphthoate synthase